jgi:endonuclease-3
VSTLVRVILSQNTRAANSDTAYANLRARFPTWHQVASARLSAIAAAVKPAGLASQRARTIREAVRRIMSEDPGLRGDYILRMSTAQMSNYLQSVCGVGPKTAACVALFAAGRDVFPVDTHILRIAKRLGWIAPNTSAARAQEELGKQVPRRLKYELHVNLIAHGRETCRLRSPRCGDCVLAGLCPRATLMA